MYLAALVLLWMVIQSLQNPCGISKEELEAEFEGIITSKSIRRWPQMEVNANGKTYLIELVAETLWEVSARGDSIVKFGGINGCRLYRNGLPLFGKDTLQLYRPNSTDCE